MNSIVAFAGFLAALWACIYSFTTLDIDALGYVGLATTVLMLILLFFAASEDISSWNEFRHKDEEE